MTQLAPIDRRAATWGVLGVLVAIAIAVLGSGNLRWFDAALVGYLFGTLFAIFAIIYRYMIWLQRPPTARLNGGAGRRSAAPAAGALTPWPCPGWCCPTWWRSPSYAAGRASAGWATSSCSGAACWPGW